MQSDNTSPNRKKSSRRPFDSLRFAPVAQDDNCEGGAPRFTSSFICKNALNEK
jgi:hypothetical protein